ncbi:hypothetical protein FQR65_LT00279 [Abscondita terminalis]|nr:hypothetical protein FQR65_LT00279 [Abscondita terminalis]
MNNGDNFVASKKRKLVDDATSNKKPRIVRNNSNDFRWDTDQQQNSLYYIPKPKSCTSPLEKSLRSNNAHILSTSQKFSANERLKSIRNNLRLQKPPNFQHNNNNKEKSVSPKKPTCPDQHHLQNAIAKPSSLDERIKSIRESNSRSRINNTNNMYGYFTSAQNSNAISPPKNPVNAADNNSPQNVVDNDTFMDWSYIEEKKVLSKINEIRNEDIITRITPSTLFQENVAKELMDIPINTTILKDIYVIVDTNIFVSQLDVIIRLLEIKVNDVTSPIVLIPWIVIQELDFLKDSRTNGKLKKQSQKAVHFINEKLSTKHPRVKGQSVRDAAQQNFSSKNADDAILHCCLQVAEKHNRAMLLSNDINLRNKAIIHGVDAYSHTEIITALDPYKGVDNSENVKVKEIELCFKNLFSYIIFMQLKESYGTALSHMDSELKNPPWTLMKCLNLFQRFWQPIFSMFLQKQFLPKVEQYIGYLNKCGGLDNIKPMDLKGYVDYGLGICVYLKNGFHMYEDSIAECVNGVENICKNLSTEFII